MTKQPETPTCPLKPVEGRKYVYLGDNFWEIQDENGNRKGLHYSKVIWKKEEKQ